MLDSILNDAENKIEQRISFLQHELAKLRVGQASPALIQDIGVSAYETNMTIKELGAISVPQPNLIVISCWDDSIVDAVAKAIMNANLGMNPVVDGKTIKVPIPVLTDERRELMMKEVGEVVENVRVDVRQIRMDKMKSLDEVKEEKSISEDDLKNSKNTMQEIVDEANETILEIKNSKLSALQNP